MARMLSWLGQQSDAESAYQQVLTRAPHNPEAQRGLAQVQDWQGHHRLAQATLALRLSDDPNDLEARRLLAQSYYSMGRPDKAVDELKLALGPTGALADATGSGGPAVSPTISNIRNPIIDAGVLNAGLLPVSLRSTSP